MEVERYTSFTGKLPKCIKIHLKCLKKFGVNESFLHDFAESSTISMTLLMMINSRNFFLLHSKNSLFKTMADVNFNKMLQLISFSWNRDYFTLNSICYFFRLRHLHNKGKMTILLQTCNIS